MLSKENVYSERTSGKARTAPPSVWLQKSLTDSAQQVPTFVSVQYAILIHTLQRVGRTICLAGRY